MSKDLEGHTEDDALQLEELVTRFRAGDEAAFDQIVVQQQRRIFNLAYRMLNNYDDASEVTQEVFVKVYRAFDWFRGDSAFSTWIYSVAVNMIRNRRRKRTRISRFEFTYSRDPQEDAEHAFVPEPVDKSATPSERIEQREIQDLVEGFLADLPTEFAEVVVMKDMQNMRYQDISDVLNCAMGTVKSRLSRGRAMLKEKLEAVYEM